ncbi:MAG: hypothetical protein KKB21_01545 [Nanoarchaeota archaeon]|nr:hypothetical protein [Nanoarchaeota archaeon]MBU4086240.1 hypothetical protein [Nanoarchaeota archaeon]
MIDAFGQIIALAFILVFFGVIFFILAVFSYFYGAVAFTFLSLRARDNHGWLAWIPIFGKPWLSSRLAKMHWWPNLLWIFAWILLSISFSDFVFGNTSLMSGLLVIAGVLGLIFFIFNCIWKWNVFRELERPGNWAVFFILSAIPVFGIFLWIVYLILLGIAAWGKTYKSKKTRINNVERRCER